MSGVSVPARHKRFRNWGFALYVLPAVAFYGVFKLWPLIHGLVLSFYKWNFISEMKYVGLANYVSMFSKSVFNKGLVNTFYYILGLFPFFIIFPLYFANLLLKVRSRALRDACKTLFFIPTVLSMAIICYVWMWMYSPGYGLFNNICRLFGYEGRSWLNDRSTAMPAVILVSGWKHFGSSLILFMAGLLNISQDCIEAARIDGANEMQIFWRIKWPLLGPTTVYMVTTAVIFAAERAFTAINILTGGGPSNVTQNLSSVIYEFAFSYFNVGLASATSMFTSVLFLIFTVLIMRLSGGFAHYEN